MFSWISFYYLKFCYSHSHTLWSNTLSSNKGKLILLTSILVYNNNNNINDNISYINTDLTENCVPNYASLLFLFTFEH